jgi:hypothetical protein
LTPEDGGKAPVKATLTQAEVPADFAMLVPIYADFDGTPVLLGRARMKGSGSLPIQMELPKKPKRMMINAQHDVLEQ